MQKKLNLLGKNYAEKAARGFNLGALICFAAGLWSLLMGVVLDHVVMINAASIYITVTSAVAALLFLNASISTRSYNALFRDRDEAISAIRVLESERRDRLARQGET